jgi:hypothetical protein
MRITAQTLAAELTGGYLDYLDSCVPSSLSTGSRVFGLGEQWNIM